MRGGSCRRVPASVAVLLVLLPGCLGAGEDVAPPPAVGESTDTDGDGVPDAVVTGTTETGEAIVARLGPFADVSPVRVAAEQMHVEFPAPGVRALRVNANESFTISGLRSTSLEAPDASSRFVLAIFAEGAEPWANETCSTVDEAGRVYVSAMGDSLDDFDAFPAGRYVFLGKQDGGGRIGIGFNGVTFGRNASPPAPLNVTGARVPYQMSYVEAEAEDHGSTGTHDRTMAFDFKPEGESLFEGSYRYPGYAVNGRSASTAILDDEGRVCDSSGSAGSGLPRLFGDDRLEIGARLAGNVTHTWTGESYATGTHRDPSAPFGHLITQLPDDDAPPLWMRFTVDEFGNVVALPADDAAAVAEGDGERDGGGNAAAARRSS